MSDSRREEALPFELKGSLFTLSILQLHSGDLPHIEQHLAAKVAQAPDFFRSTPIVIDLAHCNAEDFSLDFAQLRHLLNQHGLIPVAIREGNEAQQQAAVAAGLAVLHAVSPRATPEPAAPAETPEPTSAVAARLHIGQVRSGQQVYAQNSDLVVIGSISAGAEVLADGHIHVYGSLRGRALAGVLGNHKARIFCQKLEAELVSIAGCYRVVEKPDVTAWGKPVQIHLSDNSLIIESLAYNGPGR